MNDIRNIEDIRILVDGFYSRVRKDEELAPLFRLRIPDEAAWPEHLEKMYRFWNAVLFAQPGFDGNPVQKHTGLPLEPHHFRQWLFLFEQTADALFSGPKKEEAKLRAHAIARVFQQKISGPAIPVKRSA